MANLMLPGNPRYQPQSLVPFFGYDNLFRTVAEVEIATLRTLGEFGVIPLDEIRELTPDDERLLLNITTSDVVEVERKITKHDLRAWVRIASARLSAKRVARWLHIPLTSYDALDTARVLQFARAHQQVVASQLRDVIRVLIGLVRRHAVVLQIGRTHGQHALPITVGFWLATILNRLMSCARALDQRAADLVGKISGAVGAHNAQVALGLVSSGLNRPTFEECVLHRLGLRPASISTQILPPEPLARYLFECCLLSATLGQFGRDCRNLMRSEIREVAEQYEAGQVGSSTMAHKRNPVTFENLEGTWLKTKNEFGKVLDTLISEHQRDLVGSSLLRDDPTIIVNLVHQLESLLRTNEAGVPFLRRLTVDEAACRRHFNETSFFRWQETPAMRTSW